jgi:hypothetical protein
MATRTAMVAGDASRQENVMKKIMLALAVAAGLGTVGISIAASFAPASALCHNQRTSRFYNGVC